MSPFINNVSFLIPNLKKTLPKYFLSDHDIETLMKLLKSNKLWTFFLIFVAGDLEGHKSEDNNNMTDSGIVTDADTPSKTDLFSKRSPALRTSSTENRGNGHTTNTLPNLHTCMS